MTDPLVNNLRRARARVHRVLDRLEPLAAGYREKLARLEAEIKAIAPELDLPHRRREPNPDFARGELPRIAMDILRTAAGPLAVREIATRALARKGNTLARPADHEAHQAGLAESVRRMGEAGHRGWGGDGQWAEAGADRKVKAPDAWWG